MKISTTQIIDLPKIYDPRGNLTFLENDNQIPFNIARVFWTYDMPGGAKRGGHAYKTQNEVIIALSGSFSVVSIDISGRKNKFVLNRSYQGLLIPANNWRYIENFSTNSLSLHLSDSLYNQRDYIRDFSKFSTNE